MKQKDNFRIDFVGIGAQKAATTWIYSCLTEHPQICRSKKETDFFIQERKEPFTGKVASKSPIIEKGIEPYRKYFSHCPKNKLKGEFTSNYHYFSEVPGLIKKYFPGVKIIVSLRNPIGRAYSQYIDEIYDLKYIHKRPELSKITFEEALKLEPEFIQKGMYYQQLKRYFDLFPKENILVLIYEDIEKNPLKFIQSIYRFLGVDSSFRPKASQLRINPRRDKMPLAIRFFYLRCVPLLSNRKMGRRIIECNLVKKIFYFFIKTLSFKTEKGIQHSTRQYLREVFKEDIKKLEKLINKDLSFWE